MVENVGPIHVSLGPHSGEFVFVMPKIFEKLCFKINLMLFMENLKEKICQNILKDFGVTTNEGLQLEHSAKLTV